MRCSDDVDATWEPPGWRVALVVARSIWVAYFELQALLANLGLDESVLGG